MNETYKKMTEVLLNGLIFSSDEYPEVLSRASLDKFLPRQKHHQQNKILILYGRQMQGSAYCGMLPMMSLKSLLFLAVDSCQ